MRIKDFNDEPHFPERIKLISNEIIMNMMFKTNDERKRRRCDKIIHKATIIPAGIHQNNKKIMLQFNQKCM